MNKAVKLVSDSAVDQITCTKSKVPSHEPYYSVKQKRLPIQLIHIRAHAICHMELADSFSQRLERQPIQLAFFLSESHRTLTLDRLVGYCHT